LMLLSENVRNELVADESNRRAWRDSQRVWNAALVEPVHPFIPIGLGHTIEHSRVSVLRAFKEVSLGDSRVDQFLGTVQGPAVSGRQGDERACF
jgi:hypothetical protein